MISLKILKMKNKILNINAAKRLIKRYREITIEEINKSFKETAQKRYKEAAIWESCGNKINFSMPESLEFEWDLRTAQEIANKLAGFGDTHTCCLCAEANHICRYCIYSYLPYLIVGKDDYAQPCIKGENFKTYKLIYNASNGTELLKAFRDRADYIEEIIKKFEI